jgi:geranylgeranyl diphosphate synthase type I
MSAQEVVPDNYVQETRYYLSQQAIAVGHALGDFWQHKRAQWDGFPALITDTFDTYEAFTEGGKKLRAGLMLLGYHACQHADSPACSSPDGLLRAAGALEVLHNAFLIHDDIVDRSDLRRGKPTVHLRYAGQLQVRSSTQEDAARYGNSVALNFGDQGQALAEQLLLTSGFPSEVLVAVISKLGSIVSSTVMGQLLDLEPIVLDQLTEDRVRLIHQLKTANYTILLPLTIGAQLAGARDEVLEGIRQFSIPAGTAFQLRDDVLGLFGDESVIGKPINSDLREGKKTLLFVHAYRGASEDERRFLASVHGNVAADDADLERVKAIVVATGALKHSEELAARLIDAATSFIHEITPKSGSQRMLRAIAEYCRRRDT